MAMRKICEVTYCPLLAMGQLKEPRGCPGTCGSFIFCQEGAAKCGADTLAPLVRLAEFP